MGDEDKDFSADDDFDFLVDDAEEDVGGQGNEESNKGFWNVLVIDDDEDVHRATKYALSKFSYMDKAIKWYDAYSCEDAKRLLPALKDVAMILLDVVMETDDAGLKFMEWFRGENISPATRVILRTGQPGQAPEKRVIIEYDLHDYKSKTELSADKLFTTTVAALRAFSDISRLEDIKNGLISAHKATVTTLAKVTEYRDAHTGEHINRIARGVGLLAKEMLRRGAAAGELNEEIAGSIAVASTLHDVGKISTPDSILLKPGSLTKDEFEVMKRHTTVGAEILQGTIDLTDSGAEYLEMGRRIALYHHERWDGKGYPTGISGKDIPVEARIASIMDVFDALTNKRCYKNAFSFEESMEIILSGRGLNFDPEVVDVFEGLAGKIFEASK